jgi:hypothetical protein
MHEAKDGESPLAGVRARQSLDIMLRTAQQHHVQLSLMADTKASILITISSIVLTFALSKSVDPQLRPAMLTLAGSALLSLILAIIAVLPTFAPRRVRKGIVRRNLLFFGHFGLMSEEEYIEAMQPLLRSESETYEAMLRDIYSLGVYLYKKKYRFLRFAYVAMLTGFVLATAVEAWVMFG